MNKTLTLHVSAFLLTIVSISHLIRAINGWELTIGDWSAPIWLSALAFAITGVLAYQLWKIAK